jgi:hypothetical protein
MAPIFTSTSFTVSRPPPVGITGAPLGASDPVSLTLSDGNVVQAFDTLETALRAMEYMRQNNMWSLQVSEDVVCVSTGTKLLLLEMSLLNQKLLGRCHKR